MISQESRQGIRAELAFLLEQRNGAATTLHPAWTLQETDESFVVVGPPEDFRDHVWAIARFVAYGDFVSLERTSQTPESYRMLSRSSHNFVFEILFHADPALRRAETDA